ncbi:cysteine proteinase [Pluteus cervinus]|uniref:Cysteine proteinase n=1 Tax=Pluteus cervinus TaxID=181527 RepID=A0ACD3ANN7_9AGAR|nr:cysteine proteinase [Pluteus cervinus]
MPHRGVSPAYYEPPPAPPPVIQAPREPRISPIPPPAPSPPPRDPTPRDPTPPPPAPEPEPEPTLEPEPELEPEPAPPFSSITHIGTISTTDDVEPEAQDGDLASLKPIANPRTTLAIWSRRPTNPTQAPGIIISPRARPPTDVAQQALDLRTPPPSPPLTPSISITAPEPASLDLEPSAAPDEKAGSPPPSSLANSAILSSSVTETTESSTIPGSPISTNTSLSLTVPSTKDTSPPEESTTPTGQEVTPSDQQATVPVSPEQPTTGATPPESSTASSIPTVSVPTAPSPSTSTPAGPAPPPVKKSWASLLRPSSTSGAGPASGSSKNSLPTSSVVGFSIPASAMSPSSSSTPTASGAQSILPAAKRNELLTLLTSAPPPIVQRIKPRGLVNSGNMCFANSVLQVLVYCPPFNKLFWELGKVLGGSGAALVKEALDRERGTALVDATIEFLKEFVDEKKKSKGKMNGVVGSGRGKGKERAEEEEDDDWDGESFLPSYVYDAMKERKKFDNMRGGQQEDAEEFLGFYLDTLEEELISILNSISPPPPKSTKPSVPVEEKEEDEPPQEDGWMEVGKRNRTVVTRTIKATESPITRIFGGKFRSTLKVPHQKDSVIVEDWRSLRLDIQREQIHTIQDALSHISHPQPVQVTNPSRPGVTIEASQQVLIESLPSILILHMKRFFFDTNVGGVVKVGKQIQFGPELDIGSDVMAPTAKRVVPARYKLFGALYHHGLSASGGHYTLDVLHPNRYPNSTSTAPGNKPREGWVRIDDELVSDVRAEDVFGATERDDSRCAYLLFYKRIR